MLESLRFLLPYIGISVAITVTGILVFAVLGVVPGLPPAYRLSWFVDGERESSTSPVITFAAPGIAEVAAAAIAIVFISEPGSETGAISDEFGVTSAGGADSDVLILGSEPSDESAPDVVVTGQL